MKKIVLLFFILLIAWSTLVEPNLLVVKKYDIKNADLKGLKIVFVADFHTKTNQEEQLKKVIKKINAQNPDLILSAGDFVNGHNSQSTLPIEKIAKNLATLKSKYGIYTVLGNHDWWQDGEKITKELEKNNIKVLANSNSKIKWGAKTIYIAGVEGLYTRTPDIKKALNSINSPVILLTHSPDVFPKVPQTVDLTLAGHTHGGQIRFPFFGALVVPSNFGEKYAQGLIKENNKIMIVTKGVGTSIFPIRFNCFPEIVLINFS